MVVSIPIYALTMIYLLSAVFFLPVLHMLLKSLDQSYARDIAKERQDTKRKQTKREIEEKIAYMFVKKFSMKQVAEPSTVHKSVDRHPLA